MFDLLCKAVSVVFFFGTYFLYFVGPVFVVLFDLVPKFLDSLSVLVLFLLQLYIDLCFLLGVILL